MSGPEARIGLAVSQWLRARGFPTWHEVVVEPGGPRLDICAEYEAPCPEYNARGWGTKHSLHVIECKQRMSLALVAQAQHWTRYATRVSVAIGIDSAHPRIGDGAQRVLDALGIGILVVNPSGDVIDGNASDYVTHGAIYEDELRRALRPEQQQTAPSLAGGSYLTAHDQLVSRLREIVATDPGITLSLAVTRLGRGCYASTCEAQRELRRMLRKGGVEGVRYERSVSHGKARVQLWPAESAEGVL